MPGLLRGYRRALLALVRESIDHHLDGKPPLQVDRNDFPAALFRPAACFVTLHRHGELRGCIGTLEARQPLVQAIADYAVKAAFEDPRFAPLTRDEAGDLCIDISVLRPLQAMNVQDEAELLRTLRVGIDGLWLESGAHRATFLPQVWEQLPEPAVFVERLKHKAGLAKDQAFTTIRWSRYQVDAIADDAGSDISSDISSDIDDDMSAGTESCN